MNIKRNQLYNLILSLLIILMLIPQTRIKLQVGLNTIRALFSPSIEYKTDQEKLLDYNWRLLDREGEEVKLSSLKGQVLFINLWATWCAPCIAEMPILNSLYSDYQERVQFLFVSNEKPSKVNAFIQKEKLTIPTFLPISSNPSQLSSSSIPATFIIGKDGTIHVSGKGVANWNSKVVRNLLDQLISE